MGKISIIPDKEFLQRFQKNHNGSQSAFAKELGVSAEAVRKRLKKIGLKSPNCASHHNHNHECRNHVNRDNISIFQITLCSCDSDGCSRGGTTISNKSVEATVTTGEGNRHTHDQNNCGNIPELHIKFVHGGFEIKGAFLPEQPRQPLE